MAFVPKTLDYTVSPYTGHVSLGLRQERIY